eukprot:1185324-Prorocentrum_minimum.AAC.4
MLNCEERAGVRISVGSGSGAFVYTPSGIISITLIPALGWHSHSLSVSGVLRPTAPAAVRGGYRGGIEGVKSLTTHPSPVGP